MQDIKYMSSSQQLWLKVRTFMHVSKLETKYRIEERRNKSEGEFYALVDLKPQNGHHTQMVGKAYDINEIIVALNQVNPKAVEIWNSIPPGAEPSDYDEKPQRSKQDIRMEVGQRLHKIEPKLATGLRKAIKEGSFLMLGASSIAVNLGTFGEVEHEVNRELMELEQMDNNFVNDRCNMLIQSVIQSPSIKNKLHVGRLLYKESNHDIDVTIMSLDIYTIQRKIAGMVQKLQQDTGKSYEELKQYITIF